MRRTGWIAALILCAGATVHSAQRICPTTLWLEDFDHDNYSPSEVAVDAGLLVTAEGYGIGVWDLSEPLAPRRVATFEAPRPLALALTATTAYLLDEATLRIVDLSVPDRPRLAGSLPAPESARAMAVSGSTVHLAAGSTLTIVDAADPDSPTVVGSLPVNAVRVVGVAVSGSTVYLTGYFGLVIVDAANPASPRVVSTLEWWDFFWETVAVSGPRAFVADPVHGEISILDVSDPTTPALEGTFYAPSPDDLVVVGEVVYVGNGDHGVSAVDVTDPAAPVVIRTPDMQGWVEGLAADDGLLYVANSDEGLQVVDVLMPTRPWRPGTLALPEPGIDDVVLSGTTAYVAGRNGSGLHVVDVSDPTRPTRIADLDVATRSLALRDDVLLAWYDGTLTTVDVADPAAPRVLGSVVTGGTGTAAGVGDLAVEGATAYAVDSDGLRTVDVSDPGAPAVLGTLAEWDYVLGVAVDGHTACLSLGSDGVAVVDVRDPARPVTVGALHTPGSSTSVLVVGGLAYVGSSEGDVTILDLADPATPTVAGALESPSPADDMRLVGTTLYLADSWRGGLQLYDASDAAAPRRMGGIGVPAFTVAVDGGTAVVGDADLEVVDVSDPASPALHRWERLSGSARALAVADGLAYTASSRRGMDIVDVSDPGGPVRVGGNGALGIITWDVAVAGDTAYLGSRGFLEIVDVADPTAPMSVGYVVAAEGVRAVAVEGSRAYFVSGSRMTTVDVTDPRSPQKLGSADLFVGYDLAITGATAVAAEGEHGVQVYDVGDPQGITGVALSLPGICVACSMSGTTAYVACRDGGVQVVDVADPAAPAVIASVPSLSAASAVTVHGDRLFVAGEDRVHVLDVSDPSAPVVLRSFAAHRRVYDLAFADGVLHLAEGAFLEAVSLDWSRCRAEPPAEFQVTR